MPRTVISNFIFATLAYNWKVTFLKQVGGGGGGREGGGGARAPHTFC